MIGLAPSLYRIWSRVRYNQIRGVLEARIARPFLAAAPHRGAQRAVQEAAWTCELAAAKGEHAAATTVDMKQYYEQVTVSEVMRGARVHGLPRIITALAIDLYRSPRCIKVAHCVSRFVKPKRSILAGCTWAMVIIRLITIRPAEDLIRILKRQAETWGARISLTQYVDDGILVTSGHLDAVSYVHKWACKMLVRWVRWTLMKETAEGKLHCIASSPALRRNLAELADDGFSIDNYGEMLGIGFSAGGKITRRITNGARLRKALRRKCRLQWLRRNGGRAGRVIKDGVKPAVNDEATVSGVSNHSMNLIRRMQGNACRVRGGGTSLTARLAIGGEAFGDIDPWILDCSAPVFALLSKLWDEPRCRSELVPLWRKASEEIAKAPERSRWKNIRGIVGASMAHILRIGGRWDKPYHFTLLEHEVDVLATPPRQVLIIMRRHARQQLDSIMLRRLADDHGWDRSRIADRYRHGVDWEFIRSVLRGKDGKLSGEERWAYEILLCGGFWPEDRRWRAGYVGHGTCAACSFDIGTIEHKIVGCSSMSPHVSALVAEGRLERAPQVTDYRDDGLEPLLFLGIPPLAAQWEPDEVELIEGDLSREWEGKTYGDGSGFHQSVTEARIATWAIVRRPQDGGPPGEVMRGNVGGWFSTVPRGEMRAYLQHLNCLGPRGIYVGDCAMVVRAAAHGVPASATSSSNLNADLWRAIKNKQRDIGLDGSVALKTKAHRSRAAAEASPHEPLEHWIGNQSADIAAKSLARLSAENSRKHDAMVSMRARAINTIHHAAVAVAWNLRVWPSLGVTKAVKKKRITQRQVDENPRGHVLVGRGHNAWECARCRKWARGAQGRRAILRQQCQGTIQQRAHASHRVRDGGKGIIWCERCGAHSTRFARSLLRPCVGMPTSEAQKNRWRRLILGLTPSTAEYLSSDATLARRGVQEGAGLPGATDGSDLLGSTSVAAQLLASRALARATREHPALGEEKTGFVGRYLRLPGGPRAAAGSGAVASDQSSLGVPTRGGGEHGGAAATVVNAFTDNSNDLGTDAADLSHSRGVRRRINRKSRPDLAPGPGAAVVVAAAGTREQVVSSLCAPTSATPWTRRFCLGSSAALTLPMPCNVCRRPCRTSCRGCACRICADCALARRPCILGTSTPT